MYTVEPAYQKIVYPVYTVKEIYSQHQRKMLMITLVYVEQHIVVRENIF